MLGRRRSSLPLFCVGQVPAAPRLRRCIDPVPAAPAAPAALHQLGSRVGKALAPADCVHRALAVSLLIRKRAFSAVVCTALVRCRRFRRPAVTCSAPAASVLRSSRQQPSRGGRSPVPAARLGRQPAHRAASAKSPADLSGPYFGALEMLCIFQRVLS